MIVRIVGVVIALMGSALVAQDRVSIKPDTMKVGDQACVELSRSREHKYWVSPDKFYKMDAECKEVLEKTATGWKFISKRSHALPIAEDFTDAKFKSMNYIQVTGFELRATPPGPGQSPGKKK